jgi:hypothetical protein
LVAGVVFACAGAVAPALAVTQRSSRVAVILGEGSGSAGALQTDGVVAGAPEDSFEQFSFTYLGQEAITPAELAPFDTVVLNQVFTRSLSEAQERVLSNFVTSGGKLIIHDADGTEGNDYSWLPVPAMTGEPCENCGHTDGEAEIVEDNTIVSNNPMSPYYVDVDELPGNSDAVGDANMLVTNDPRWDEDIRASNDQNVEGAVDAYASDGGLIMYNGFDTDFLGEGSGVYGGEDDGIYPSGVDWLDKIWFDELDQQWNPDDLPHGNPVVGTSGHCGYHAIRVGVVLVCAETISGAGSETTASGNVVLDGGVAVGNGPVEIDQETKQISVTSPAAVSILRTGTPESLGTAAFTIEAAGTTDPISGKGGLAKVSLTGANLPGLAALRVGGLPFSLPASGSATFYLDGELGGGLIGAGSLQLSMLGRPVGSGSLSLGLYAGAAHPVQALGGSVGVGAVELGKGWKFGGLSLSYQQPSDTWTASGGLEVPIGSLQASGSIVGGRLDSMHVSIGGQEVPLGDSGFFFTEFGGGFSGLVKGPLQIDASTAGFWGVPKAPVEPFYLDNVTVTVDFGGSVTLDGAVSLALKDHSPVHGHLRLQIGIHPFTANGGISVEGELPGVSLKASGGAAFTSKHFTGSERGELKVFGLSGSGQVIVSDKGMGASGTLCAPLHVACKTVALAGTWSQIGRLDVPAIVGGRPQSLVTVAGAAATGAARAVRVAPRRTLLLLTIRGGAGAPSVRLRAPGGRVYGSGRSTGTVIFSEQPQFGLSTVAVIDPRPGLWRIAAAPGQQGPLRISAQTVAGERLIQAVGVFPRGSARDPLRVGRRVLLRWRSRGLPRGVRVSMVRRSKPHEAGVGVLGGLPASGHVWIPVAKLAAGRNYVSLAATLDGVQFEDVHFRGVIWRKRASSRRGAKHR